MFSHIYIGASDFTRAYTFYAPIMTELGLRQRFYVAERSWAGWQPGNGGRPLFIVGLPCHREPHDPGNGQMVAFMAKDRATV